MTASETFFSLLKSHREAKGIEIDEIAEFTKINPKYLLSIESGHFDVLPNVYMRLFIRSYVEFIGADPAQALDDYELHTTGIVSSKDEFSAPPVIQTTEEKENPQSLLGNSPIPPKQIITGVGVLVGIFLFFQLVSSLSKDANKDAVTAPAVEDTINEVDQPIKVEPDNTITNPAETATESKNEALDTKKKP